MSDVGGYESEMLRRRLLDDATSEAILTGRSPVPEELAGLACFAEDTRALGRGPVPVPAPELTAMFVDGFSVENGDLLVTAASNVHGPAQQAAGLPKRRNKKMTVAEFLAGLSLGAKAALGVGIAAASVTGAAAAGVLPDAAQHAVSSTVNSLSPFPDLPDSTNGPDATNGHADFGKTVSADATGTSDGTKGVDGQTVSGNAAQNGLDTANSTPAAGHVPTSLPSGPSSTPGGDNVPTSVPPAASTPGSESSTGTDTASNTQADGHVPTTVPPSGRP